MDGEEDRWEEEIVSVCPTCGLYWPLSGQHNWFRHQVVVHPQSEAARSVEEALEGIVRGRTA